MGLLSFLFPTPEKRIAKARKLIDNQQWVDARNEVLGLEDPEALELVAVAGRGLVGANLDAALSWGHAGDEDRVQIHLELAEQFHEGGLEDRFRDVRKVLRELRAARKASAEQAEVERSARLAMIDPLGFSGSSSLLSGLGADLTGPDAEELRARLALLVENYPPVLQEQVPALGPAFARAVLDHDEGRPDLALQALVGLPDDVAIVRYERSRVVYAMNDLRAAVRELKAFARLAGGHHTIGQSHTGVLLAQYTAEQGDMPGALRILRDVRASVPDAGGFLFAQLLLASGALEEAEMVLRGLIRKYPSETMFYRLLAEVRVRGGFRVEAMNALERALQANHCTPGRCGYKAPDLAVHRRLATLYLEDGIEMSRALELAQEAAGAEGAKGWEDAYLTALVAKRTGSPELGRLQQQLLAAIPDGDPRRAQVEALNA